MKPEETLFHEITLQDKAWMDQKFAEDDRNACEYSFANNFMWRNVYQVRVAELHGCLVVRFIRPVSRIFKARNVIALPMQFLAGKRRKLLSCIDIVIVVPVSLD